MSFGKKSILIIDDESSIRNSLAVFVERFDFLPVLAGDGSEGIFKARNQQFDLIITDIMMPRMNGIKLIRSVREDFTSKKDDSNQSVPIIVMSGNLSEFSADLAVIDDLHLIDKPFSIEKMGELIRFLSKKKEACNLPGEDTFSLTNKVLLKQVSDTFAILCKEAPVILKSDQVAKKSNFGHQFNIHNNLIINGRYTGVVFGLSLSWISAASTAILAEKGQAPQEDKNFDIIGLLNNALIRRLIKNFEREGIQCSFINTTMSFHEESRVNNQAESDFQIWTNVSTTFGQVEVYHFMKDEVMKKVG